MYIYFITDGFDIKVGKTEDLEKRIRELQTGNSNKLEIVYYIENVDDYFEKHIHGICSSYKLRGEWFKVEVIKFLLNHPFFKDNMKEVKNEKSSFIISLASNANTAISTRSN